MKTWAMAVEDLPSVATATLLLLLFPPLVLAEAGRTGGGRATSSSAAAEDDAEEAAADPAAEETVVVPLRTFHRLTRRRGGAAGLPLPLLPSTGGQSTAATIQPLAAATQWAAGGWTGRLDPAASRAAV